MGVIQEVIYIIFFLCEVVLSTAVYFNYCGNEISGGVVLNVC